MSLLGMVLHNATVILVTPACCAICVMMVTVATHQSHPVFRVTATATSTLLSLGPAIRRQGSVSSVNTTLWAHNVNDAWMVTMVLHLHSSAEVSE